MQTMKCVYGPVPSRRLGNSLGISPIPRKTCNYSCVYCQLGRTNHLINKRSMFFLPDDIIGEFEEVINKGINFDVVTIVGEGEPTLYMGLGRLIFLIKKATEKPVAVITNGALLGDPEVRAELSYADIVLPSLDAYDEASFRKINRPYGLLDFAGVYQGLREFSHSYAGHLWLETMLVAGLNDHPEAIEAIQRLLQDVLYDRLYINAPVRPPAEAGVAAPEPAVIEYAAGILGGSAINVLESSGFCSLIEDHYDAIMSIIKRHPMNQHEIKAFLESRGCEEPDEIKERMHRDESIRAIEYMGYITYRLK